MDLQKENSKNPTGLGGVGICAGSAEADLRQDALAGQKLGTEADDEAQHGKAPFQVSAKLTKPKREVESDMGENRLVGVNVTKDGICCL